MLNTQIAEYLSVHELTTQGAIAIYADEVTHLRMLHFRAHFANEWRGQRLHEHQMFDKPGFWQDLRFLEHTCKISEGNWCAHDSGT